MRRLRTASTRRLVTIVAVLVATVAAAGIAQAALKNSPTPDAKPLDRAIQDAVNAPPVAGITARVKFTNNLLPSGSMPGSQVSPILSGADGRVWLSGDGKVRLELQSDYGDAQLVADGERYMLYDAATKSAFTGRLPAKAPKSPAKPEKVSLTAIQEGLKRLGEAWTLSGAQPTSTAGRPTYTVRIAPKDDGGLLGAAELAWDAVRGAPLRAAIYAQGNDEPVLEVEATEVSYGKIGAGEFSLKPPAGAKVTEIDPPAGLDAQGRQTHVEGVEAVQKQLAFPLAAPEKLAGLPRRSVSLVRFGDTNGALARYGSGFGQILVFERKSDGQKGLTGGFVLPQVNIDGATGSELATALGTLLTFERDGVRYVVAGSVPPVAAENAARELR
jgi:outer membrane lipoprotein-sorting protein